MNLLIALALQSTSAPAVVDTVDPDIVITANKLDRWRGRFSLRGEKFKCKTVRSSGDKAIDPIGCAAIAQCLEPHRERIRQSDDKTLGTPEQIAIKKAIMEEVGPCVGTTRKAMITDFVARRRAAAQ